MSRKHISKEGCDKLGGIFDEMRQLCVLGSEPFDGIEQAPPPSPQPEEPKDGGGMEHEIYERDGCHYCDEQKKAVQKLRESDGNMNVREIDISKENPLGLKGTPVHIFKCNGQVIGKAEGLQDERELADLRTQAADECRRIQKMKKNGGLDYYTEED